MVIKEISSGKLHKVNIIPVEKSDYQILNKERYFFNWKFEEPYDVYKLQIVESMEVLGLISMERIPSEWRIHIRLLTVSLENKGKMKKYEGIAGNLIAFAAKNAVRDYGELACISLRPKTRLVRHYMERYNMTLTGKTLSIMVPEILELINFYDHD